MVLVQKWPFLQFFFWAIQTRQMSFTIFQSKKIPFQRIKTRSSKSRKIDILVLVQKWPFFLLFFFLGNIDQENVFYDILERKKRPFQAIKTRSLKRRKIDIFVKGLTHGFGKKTAIFQTLFFQAIQTWKMSFTIFWNKKIPFQGIKTRSSKSQKFDIFLKWLTHGFGPKMAIYAPCSLANKPCVVQCALLGVSSVCWEN